MNQNHIFIIVQRDAKNLPFAKIKYSNDELFNLCDETEFFATELSNLALNNDLNKDGLVLIDANSNYAVDINECEIPLYISGCESGKDNVLNLINVMCYAANKMNVQVIVTSGEINDEMNQPFFINEREISERYNYLDNSIIEKNENKKLELLNNLIKENIIKEKSYIKNI